MIPRGQQIRLDRKHPLSSGNVLAMLGRGASTNLCIDSSGFGNNGTLTGMDAPSDWIFSPELGRYALDFDGTNDYVLGVSGANFAGTEITIACWAKNTTQTGSLSLLGCGTNNDRINVHFPFSGTIYWDFGDQEGAGRISKAAPTLTQWGHWAFTASGGTAMAIHQNGLLWHSGGADANGYAGTGQLKIGAFTNLTSGTTYYYPGRIADPCIWNRALSPAEIQILADRSDPTYRDWIYDASRTVVSFAGVAPAARLLSPWINRTRMQRSGR